MTPARLLALALVPALLYQPPTGQVTQPFVGITVVERREREPRPLRLHVAQIDLDAPGIRFKVSPPGGAREVMRQSTLAFLAQERAQLAINSHFFLPFPSTDATAWVIGLGASDGRVFSAFEIPEQSYALVAFAPAINIDRDNRASIVHYDPSHSDRMHVGENVTLWNAVSGSSQIVTNGVVTIPAYRDDNHFDAELDPGGPNSYSNAKAWADVTTARTAIGLSQDRRTLTWFTVDMGGGSDGMRLAEVAALLIRDFGVWDALNLDGGGSTTMAMEGADGAPSLVNVSSDNPAGRVVATSLAVFAQRRERYAFDWRSTRSSRLPIARLTSTRCRPQLASGLPAAPRSPVMSSTRGSAGSPCTPISK